MATMRHPKTTLFLSVSLILSLLVSADVVDASQAVVNSTCADPELCVSTVALAAAIPVVDSITQKVGTLFSSAYKGLKKISTPETLTKAMEKILKALDRIDNKAIADCLELVKDAMENLDGSKAEVPKLASDNTVRENITALLDDAMTGKATCLDGFSHHKDKKLREDRELIMSDPLYAYSFIAKAITIIQDLPSLARPDPEERGPVEEDLPGWLSEGDKLLLQGSTVKPHVTVAADGSGDHRTVAEAVAGAPDWSSTRYVIRIKAGVYRENVKIPRKKTNLMFVGDGRKTTIITASRNVVDGDTTFSSATVAVAGRGFLARDITFQNAAGRSKHQAVALRVNADLCAFYRCNMLAYQGTLYVHSFRQFYTGCRIAGTVDFIFGNAAVVFQHCDILARRPIPGQNNTVTAQGRDGPRQKTGIVFQRCRIDAAPERHPVRRSFRTYLGRPWRAHSRTVVMESVISDVIDPAGWSEWDGDFGLATLFYAEYRNTGAGAGTGKRVKWGGFRVLTKPSEAQPFTARNFLGGGN